MTWMLRPEAAEAKPVVVTSTMTIGRDDSCDLIVRGPRAPVVSSRHCELRLEAGLLLVRDLGAANGIYVNREKVTSEQVLQHGDMVQLGNGGPVYYLEQQNARGRDQPHAANADTRHFTTTTWQ